MTRTLPFQMRNPEIEFAVRAVRLASQLVRQVQAEMVSPALTKDDRSPVTVADFASQALVAALLNQAFPNDPLVAEEDSTALRGSGSQVSPLLEQVTQFVAHFVPQAEPDSICRWIDQGTAEPARRFWTLDPIDGTKGFLRGDQYAVALGLIIDGQVQVGVLGCPNLGSDLRVEMGGAGSLVVASRSHGTWSTPVADHAEYERLHVSARQDPAHARLMRSFESGHTNVDQIEALAHALGTTAEPVRMDSQAKYAVLAAGGGDLLVRLLSPSRMDYREKIWDHAAGSLVLEEAGGKISDLHGKTLDFTTGRSLLNNRGLLASNGLLHPAALQALRLLNA